MAAPDIAGYTIERLLGRGGFASVYLATRRSDGVPVAIKVLLEHIAGTDALIRFERERLSMSALSAHPHIVDVLDSGTTAEEHHYIVLEYVSGGSVKDRLVGSGALPWPEVTAIGIQICGALDAAHRIGVLHRDLKPANIFLDSSGAKLGDFGIARLVGSSDVTAAESIIGTLAFTPPEILRSGAFDGRGDIYQLGITLYEMLLGRAPFKSGASDSKAVVIRRILEDPAPALAQFDVPEPLSTLLDEVLAKDPADRPQSASEFARRLGDVEEQLGMSRTRFAGAPDLDPGERPESESTATARRPEPTITARRPLDATAVLSAPAPQTHLDQPGSASPSQSPRPRPSSSTPRRNGRRRSLLVIAVLVSAAVAAALIRASLGDTGDIDQVNPPDSDGPSGTPYLERVDQPAFEAPPGSDGVVFSAVGNSAGITAVGGAGDGEGVGDQRGVVWTMAADGSWAHQGGFASLGTGADQQRLRGIAVIDGVRLLAVGERAAGQSLDGSAWLGLTAARMQLLTHPSFSGSGRQTLQAAVGDAAREHFLVVGERRGPSGPQPGLWVLEAGPGDDWLDPRWTDVPLEGTATGMLADVALAGDVAVAAGHEQIGSGVQGIILIRRGNAWSPLVAPLPDTKLTAIDIFGDRVVAVGTRDGATGSQALAVVSDVSGNGFLHRLPTDGVSGRAHDVVTTTAGTFAVGTVSELDVDDVRGSEDSNGAIWELLPGPSAEDDVWVARGVDDLDSDGVQEIWTVVEFDNSVFALGRADTDGRRPAAAWTLTGAVATSDEAVGDVEATEIGCAEQADSDVGQRLEFVEAGVTDEFAVWICRDESGNLWYHGASREVAGQSITLPAVEDGSGFVAVNTGGTTYRIADGRLTVRSPAGVVRTDQPLIDSG